MSFTLPSEYLELQASVRKLAQEKVQPRAREIDTSGEYPQDLFDAFRAAGLLGLVAPEEYGGGGGGILGLTVAIEEVAKYSNTAASLFGRGETGRRGAGQPPVIRGVQERGGNGEAAEEIGPQQHRQ